MSGTALPLRPYQAEGLAAVATCHARGVSRPAVVWPTGSGKTVAFAHLAARTAALGLRTLVTAHTRELVEQAAGTVRAVAPGLSVGVEMAERHAEPTDDVVVASVQTLGSERRLRRWERNAVGLYVVDECHHALGETYVRAMDHFRCFADDDPTPAVGFTATLARGDGAGLGAVWQEVAHKRSIGEMVADGYLVRPRGISVPLDSLDVSKLRTSHGEYTASSAEEALGDDFAEKVAAAYAEYAADRSGLVFLPTVRAAHMACDALTAAGFKTATVWGEQDRDERRAAVEDARRGDVQVLCNCNALTEGFDAPRMSCAVIVRPLRSAPLLIQIVGRVLRPFPGKDDALVLDMVGATKRQKLTTLVDLGLAEKPPASDGPEVPPEGGEPSGHGRERYLGEVGEVVDLFEASPSVWLRTKGGHWFVPAAEGQVFLREWPTRNGWSIGWAPRAGPIVPLGRAPELTLAMALGEEHAARAERDAGRGYSVARRGAAWRGRGEPSPKQLETAARMRVQVPPGATAGEVSDLISVRVASGRIDAFFARRSVA